MSCALSLSTIREFMTSFSASRIGGKPRDKTAQEKKQLLLFAKERATQRGNPPWLI